MGLKDVPHFLAWRKPPRPEQEERKDDGYYNP